ncbi:MAG: Flp pilus assembly protein CpaB [Chitinophagales bacterium]|nr:Flp pilus assembly protein CpaB [Hyphomicrobiales bacterium]
MNRQQIILFTIAGASASLSGLLIYYSLTQATTTSQNALGAVAEIHKSAVLAKPAGSLSSRINPNMRAVSISFKDEGGVETLLMANDSVDVIVTRTTNSKTTESETVLHSARVLIGAQTQNPASVGRPTKMRLVTLEVTPAQAELLANERSAGKLSLVLAGANDTARRDANAPSHSVNSRIKMFKFGVPAAVFTQTSKN